MCRFGYRKLVHILYLAGFILDFRSIHRESLAGKVSPRFDASFSSLTYKVLIMQSSGMGKVVALPDNAFKSTG